MSLFSVWHALKGYNKVPFCLGKRSLITLLSQLCRITTAICFFEYRSSVISVAFFLAFFAALRISEILSATKTSRRGLQFSYILLDHNRLSWSTARLMFCIGAHGFIRILFLALMFCCYNNFLY